MVEGRGLTKANTASTTGSGHRAGMRVSQGLDHVRQAAERNNDARFTALLHHVDVECLRDAYRAINPKRRQRGEDGVMWEAYGENLEANTVTDQEGRSLSFTYMSSLQSLGSDRAGRGDHDRS